MSPRLSMQHDLKTWPAFFAAVLAGDKRFELRRDDRDYQVGDTLLLREWDPETQEYSGREVTAPVTYIVRGPKFGLEAGNVVMSLGASTFGWQA